VALETKPAWAVELETTLAQPYSHDELERLHAWARRIEQVNAGKVWPAGAFQRLLDLARAEDSQRGE
jgi:hypothetical protein